MLLTPALKMLGVKCLAVLGESVSLARIPHVAPGPKSLLLLRQSAGLQPLLLLKCMTVLLFLLYPPPPPVLIN